jgi:hypothetical protein
MKGEAVEFDKETRDKITQTAETVVVIATTLKLWPEIYAKKSDITDELAKHNREKHSSSDKIKKPSRPPRPKRFRLKEMLQWALVIGTGIGALIGTALAVGANPI